MKQLLIFFIMLVCVFFVDLKAVSLSDAYPDTITVSVEGEVASPGSYELHITEAVRQKPAIRVMC